MSEPAGRLADLNLNRKRDDDHMTTGASSVSALAQSALTPWKIDNVAAWRSGWLGIVYGVPTHGFAELSISPGRGAIADFWWLGGDGDVHHALLLRYVRARARIDFYVSADDFEPWERECSELIPVPGRKPLATLCCEGTTNPDELFTRIVALYAETFEILAETQAPELHWDHHFKPGPAAEELWGPADLGAGIAPFAVRSAPPPSRN
jgi:hypothetical protein